MEAAVSGQSSLLLLALAGCTAPGDTAHSAPGPGTGGCLLSFYSAEYDPRCQSALDAACCPEEKACGVDSDCYALVRCIDACPAPRQDACVNACGDGTPNPPGLAHLTGVSECGKSTKYQPPTGVSCAWP